ncbi:MAG: hypothetical protein Q7U53_09820 [Anaerolineaceae bacterium]|nr:hypothetical protein [Anaerolineaceae bacterium]
MHAFFEIPGLNVYIQMIVTIFSISVLLFKTRNKVRKESTIEIITIFTIGFAGWFTMMSGLFGHIIFADQVALDIGWPVNSGFQMELGFASIGIGIVGFLGFWNKSVWLPFIIIKTLFMWGAGFTHIYHAVQHNNFSPGNVGVILYWDFLFPLVMITLYLLYRRERNKRVG